MTLIYIYDILYRPSWLRFPRRVYTLMLLYILLCSSARNLRDESINAFADGLHSILCVSLQNCKSELSDHTPQSDKSSCYIIRAHTLPHLRQPNPRRVSPHEIQVAHPCIKSSTSLFARLEIFVNFESVLYSITLSLQSARGK